jgi:PPOX class probable F420-dependent enzyme
MISDTVRALVSTGPLAHLTTLNSDGSPQVTVVWLGIQDEEFVTAHLGEYRKIKNIRIDGRVALSLLGKARTPQGLLEYVVAHGTARVTDGGAVDLLTRLAKIYIGPEKTSRHRLSGIDPALLSISDQSVSAGSGRGRRTAR